MWHGSSTTQCDSFEKAGGRALQSTANALTPLAFFVLWLAAYIRVASLLRAKNDGASPPAVDVVTGDSGSAPPRSVSTDTSASGARLPASTCEGRTGRVRGGAACASRLLQLQQASPILGRLVSSLLLRLQWLPLAAPLTSTATPLLWRLVARRSCSCWRAARRSARLSARRAALRLRRSRTRTAARRTWRRRATSSGGSSRRARRVRGRARCARVAVGRGRGLTRAPSPRRSAARGHGRCVRCRCDRGADGCVRAGGCRGCAVDVVVVARG